MNLDYKAPSPRPSPAEREREKGRQRNVMVDAFMGSMREFVRGNLSPNPLLHKCLVEREKDRVTQKLRCARKAGSSDCGASIDVAVDSGSDRPLADCGQSTLAAREPIRPSFINAKLHTQAGESFF
jgi:hypothetical protein